MEELKGERIHYIESIMIQLTGRIKAGTPAQVRLHMGLRTMDIDGLCELNQHVLAAISTAKAR